MQSVPASVVRWNLDHDLAVITLQVGVLARQARPGQYVVLDLAAADGDPHLLRSAFVAAADAAAGTLEVWFDGAAAARDWPQPAVGRPLIVSGMFGSAIPLPRNGNLLLVGQGPALAALFLLMQQSLAGCSVVFVPLTTTAALPLQRLPAAVEVLNGIASPAELGHSRSGTAPLNWADQVIFALPFTGHEAAAQAVRTARLRWNAGFAWLLSDLQAHCVSAVCRVCRVTTRRGSRLLCRDGPLFDLRDV